MAANGCAPSQSLSGFVFSAVMQLQLLFLLYDRPLSLSRLRSLTVASPRPVERSGRAACPNAPATAPEVATLTRRAQSKRKMIMTLQADDKLMSLTDVSEMLGIPVRTLYRWRYKGDGPVGYRVGRHVRYRREAVEAWLEQQVDQH